MIATTISTTDFLVIVTQAGFPLATQHASRLDLRSQVQQQPYSSDVVTQMQTNSSGGLHRLEVAQCVDTYNHEFISDWSNVVLVSDAVARVDLSHDPHEHLNGSAVLQVLTIDQSGVAESPSWFCNLGVADNYLGDSGQSNCTTSGIISSGEWNLAIAANANDSNAIVLYCLAEKIEPQCRVTFNVLMLFICVICNALKLISFLLILFLPGFKPIVTVGDAIASFLTYPDSVTAYVGAPIMSKDRSWTPPVLLRSWKPQRCHWFCGASFRRWSIAILS